MIGRKVIRTLASVEIEIVLILGLPCCLSSSSVRCLESAYLDGTTTESEPFKDPTDTKTPESPLAIAPPILVPILCRTARMAVRIPYAMSSGLSASMAKVAAMSEFVLRKRFRSSYESSPSVSPPDLPLRKRYHENKGPTAEDEDPAVEDEGLTAAVEGPGMDDEDYDLDDETHGMDDEGRGIDDEEHCVESDGLGLEEEEAVPGGQRQVALVVRTTSSGSAQESERPERVSAFRQPTLTTWTDLEEGMIYIDIPNYPPPAPPVQTPPSPEWTSGLLPISPSHSDVPSPISSPMIPLTVPSPVATPATVETEGFLTEMGAQVEMQGGLIHDHAVRLEELSPALFERYDRDIGELFTRSGVRPVLALEAWAGQTDAQRAALWYAISDVQGENRDLQLQLAEERRARLELAEVVDGMRRGQEPIGGA
ncbi:hypothetical protein Tco_1028518 [Tanacetum coccineum]|uniref:Uncharacterized protein n=1 Tax=Tanacetum coccineum TaxID=301880 RepID=A0ABQ5G2Z9_9ASTR